MYGIRTQYEPELAKLEYVHLLCNCVLARPLDPRLECSYVLQSSVLCLPSMFSECSVNAMLTCSCSRIFLKANMYCEVRNIEFSVGLP